jgi:hypothetical protein
MAIVDRPKHVASSVINTISETIAICVRLYTTYTIILVIVYEHNGNELLE